MNLLVLASIICTMLFYMHCLKILSEDSDLNDWTISILQRFLLFALCVLFLSIPYYLSTPPQVEQCEKVQEAK